MKFKEDIHKLAWGSEEWLCSAHPSSPSMIIDGENAGKRLNEVYPNFPVLLKRIHAESTLSVQVHPDERGAKIVGGEPKTEMWYILKGGPIYAGLKAGTTAEQVRKAAQDGTIEKLLIRHDAHIGEIFFIPGGLVHAIGEGTEVYEVQQSSNTRFRLYDWGRNREIRLEEALKVIDFNMVTPKPHQTLRTKLFCFHKEDIGDEGREYVATTGFLSIYKRDIGNILLAKGERARISTAGEVLITEFQ